MNQILFKIFKSLMFFCLDRVYNYIDKDKDGKLNKKEIQSLIKDLEKIKNKIKKK